MVRLGMFIAAIAGAYMVGYGEEVAVPALINYQGTLTNADGTAMPPGEYTIEFRIWASKDGTADGDRIWGRSFSVTLPDPTEGEGDSPPVAGCFNVLLSDDGNEIRPTETFVKETLAAALQGSERYIGLTITAGPGITGSPVTITPRQRFLSTPYAFVSGNGVPVGSILPWIPYESVSTDEQAQALLPWNFKLCVTQDDDPNTPHFDESTIPDLTGDCFLMGSAEVPTLGQVEGENTHRHAYNGITPYPDGNFQHRHPHNWAAIASSYYHKHHYNGITGDGSHLPSNVTVLFIIRVE